MKTHYSLSDHEFEKQFADLSLKPTLFSHEAHLRLAWIHINKYGVKQAIRNITTQIKAFATFHNEAAKYNHTVTIAAIRAVYHFVLKSEADTFEDLMRDFPRLENNFKGLLNSHYSDNIFANKQAKKTYIEPDLEPFDAL